jgi:hypothetical protein
MGLVITAVYYARDPSHRLRTTPGQKENALRKLPERVLERVQLAANFFLKGRNPVWVLSIDLPWKVYEVL